MGATTAQIDTAIYNALAAYAPDPGPPTDAQPFAAVVRITEPLTKDNVDAWVAGQWPCAMLYFQQGAIEEDFETLGGGDHETRESDRWVVYVGCADPRDEDAIVQGATGVPGVLSLYGTVKSAVNGLHVGGPAATLVFTCSGTAGQTDTIDTRARIQFTVNGKTLAFQPTATSVTWGGGGTATIAATCVTPNALGNLPVALSGGAWNSFAPAHATGAAITIASIQTTGQDGGLRNKFVRLVDSRYALASRGAYVILAATFEAQIAAEQVAAIDESRTLTLIHGDVNEINPTTQGGTGYAPPNPVDQFELTP